MSELKRKRRVLIVTGTRAEFGLLKPVMKAVQDRVELELLVVAAGSHLVQPALTFKEVKAEFEVADSVPMQTAGRIGRDEDVESVGKGISRFGRSFSLLDPDWVVVLGDRIEAFAAASAASIGGWALAHIHGGDRAEGVADEAMRHAITKMSHVHLPATAGSAERILRMGENPERVFAVGSPAVDGLGVIPEMPDEKFLELGNPEAVVLMHPCGRKDDVECEAMRKVLHGVEGKRLLVLYPNLDPGRRGILDAIGEVENNEGVVIREHLGRNDFVGLLKRIGKNGGALVGNSSAGLIECAAIGCASVDIGIRQSGRERFEPMTLHVEAESGANEIADALKQIASRSTENQGGHQYGDGTAGVQIARVLVEVDPAVDGFTRKRCSY